ncbi:MAG TPA: PEP-CTERM sorting domain-containing protein [Janthinobacterium sp.]|nr:PEP-CTERM sorting domain-containing protein [Janthinobacterium sp.]
MPEPQAYALLLGGLGMVGAMARRRRMSAAALA